MKVPFRKTVCALPLLILTACLCGFSPSTPDTPLTFSRDPESAKVEPHTPLPGTQAAFWEKEKPPLNNRIALSSSSFSDFGTFAATPLSSAAVFIENEDPLLVYAALAFIKELDVNGLDTVQLYYPKQTIPDGALKPDLFISLRSESSGTTNNVYMIGGNSYLGDTDPWERPTSFMVADLKMDCDTTLEHRIANEESKSDDFLSAEQLGWKFGSDQAQSLNKNLNKWAEEHGVFPTFPSSFVPDWKPAPQLAFLTNLNARQILSTHSPLTYNTTAWVFTSTDSPSNLLSTISAQLQDQGWSENRLRISDYSRLLHIEKEDEGFFLKISEADDDTDAWLGDDIAEKRANGDIPYIAVFSHPMSFEESRPIISTLLSNNPTPAQALEIAFYREDRFKEETMAVFDRLAPKMSPRELYQVAQWFKQHIYVSADYDYRPYFIQSVLKNLWGDFNEELRQEQEEWANKTPHLSNLLPLKSLPHKLTDNEQRSLGIDPLRDVVGTEVTRAIDEPFAVSVPPLQIQCWNVYSDGQELRCRQIHYFSGTYSESNQPIHPGETLQQDLDLAGETYSVTIQAGPQGDTWSIRISDAP